MTASTPDEDLNRIRVLGIMNSALQALWMERGNLLARRTAERSVTHRLAVHLEKTFFGYETDCEYNRNGPSPKSIPVNLSDLARVHQIKYIDRMIKKGVEKYEAESRAFYEINVNPDIIVHKREFNDGNLLVVELKYVDDDRGEEGRLFDLAKLKAFTSLSNEYKYAWGVFVEIDQDSAALTLVLNGKSEQESITITKR